MVSYASEAAIVGRLGKFGLGVTKKKAESLGREFAAAFKQKVEQTATALTGRLPGGLDEPPGYRRSATSTTTAIAVSPAAQPVNRP